MRALSVATGLLVMAALAAASANAQKNKWCSTAEEHYDTRKSVNGISKDLLLYPDPLNKTYAECNQECQTDLNCGYINSWTDPATGLDQCQLLSKEYGRPKYEERLGFVNGDKYCNSNWGTVNTWCWKSEKIYKYPIYFTKRFKTTSETSRTVDNQRCQEACQSYPGCQYASTWYKVATKMFCRLFKRITTTKNKYNGFYGPKYCPKRDIGCFTKDIAIKDIVTVGTGSKLRNYLRTAPQETYLYREMAPRDGCQNVCQEDDKCNGITYRAHYGVHTCKLFQRDASAGFVVKVPLDGFESGPKYCP